MDKDYINRLEGVIKQMLTPLKDIPFNLVIESMTGRKVTPFDKENSQDQELLNVLIKVAKDTSVAINKKGIESKRPNEVGNYVEPYVRETMENYDLKPDIPSSSNGKKKNVGYPDVVFFYKGRPQYLECKTYNFQNVATTQRSFYFSPSENFKVIYDAHHFILSYQMEMVSQNKGLGIYKCKHFKILSCETLSLDVKYEFNSDNARMYSGRNGTIILNEGDC